MIIRTKALIFLFILLILPSCGSSDDYQTIGQSVQYKTTAISAQEYSYGELIVLSGTTMTITRTGGNNINVGTWTISLSSKEISAINEFIYTINTNTAEDIVDDMIIFDAPLSEVIINDSKSYFQGTVTLNSVTKYHGFSPYVANLTQYIESLIKKYGHEAYK